MKMFKRLLVAVDNSAQAAYAVDTAARLATQLGADVILTHICVLPSSSDPQIAFIAPDVYTLCMDAGEALLNRMKARMPGSLHVTTDLREGDPAADILNAAQFFNVDLIIMGSHARGRVAQAMLGSVARGVMQKAACPVLTVARPLPPDHSAATPGRRQSVALDSQAISDT